MTTPSQRLNRFARLVRTGECDTPNGPLRLSVDLGTANVVLSVVDGEDQPVAGALRESTVVRDGIVVDWLGAVTIVRELKQELEHRVGAEFRRAAITTPPGINEATIKVFRNVIEAGDMNTDEVVDEPVAAATALGIDVGTIIDIGHGTTGVSVLRDGRVELSVDEPTGGHHMTLVIAGALGMDYNAAEAFKRAPDNSRVAGQLVRPTLEKMATIAADALAGHDPGDIVLVGGASSLPNAPEVFADILSRPVIRSTEPLFPTPLGAAMRRNREDQP